MIYSLFRFSDEPGRFGFGVSNVTARTWTIVLVFLISVAAALQADESRQGRRALRTPLHARDVGWILPIGRFDDASQMQDALRILHRKGIHFVVFNVREDEDGDLGDCGRAFYPSRVLPRVSSDSDHWPDRLDASIAIAKEINFAVYLLAACVTRYGSDSPTA